MKPGFKKRIAFELFRSYRKNETRLHRLNYLFWECTLRCNLNCLHCGSDCRTSTEIKDMPADDFLGVVRNMLPAVDPLETMIVFTGGEPLMRKDIEQCGKELQAMGFPWGLVSNGYLLDEKRLVSLVDAGMTAATISLDGFANSHNALRRNDKSYTRAMSAIQLLARAEGLRYDVVTCVSSLNIHELHDLKKILIRSGVKEWRIFTIFPIGRADGNQKLYLSNEQFRHLFDFISATRKEGIIRVNYGCEGFLGEYEGEVRDNFFFCRAGINIGSILADGSISACPNLREKFIQGNIYRDDFMQTWNEKFRPHRDRKWMKTGMCSDCNLFRYCEGNSLHLRAEDNELLLCHMKKLE